MLKKRYFKTKSECEVTFEHTAPATEVALVIEANNWEPVTMKKGKGDTFQAKVRLPMDGRYQFRYLVDKANWANDEAADAYWPNEYGETNSVVDTYSVN
jgi:1,4-alpha-glucan branching enzyme